MINFDTKTMERLEDSRIKIQDKLFLFARFIEEKYQLEIQPNYWEDKFELMDSKERIFYKVWLWMNYVELESFVKPILEFENVFGDVRKKELEKYLEQEIKVDNLESFYFLDGKGGAILLDWALKELKTTD